VGGPSKENYESLDFVNIREIINHLSNFHLMKELLHRIFMIVKLSYAWFCHTVTHETSLWPFWLVVLFLTPFRQK